MCSDVRVCGFRRESFVGEVGFGWVGDILGEGVGGGVGCGRLEFGYIVLGER